MIYLDMHVDLKYNDPRGMRDRVIPSCISASRKGIPKELFTDTR